jgi:hypothetical protein
MASVYLNEANLRVCPTPSYDPALDPNNTQPDYGGNGVPIQMAQCKKDPIKDMINEFKKFIGTVGAFLSIPGQLRQEIFASAGILKEIAGGLVAGLMNALTKKLKKVIEEGVIAFLAATGGLGLPKLIALIPAMSALEKGLVCAMNKIINGLFDTIVDMLASSVMNVANFATCAAEQFAGGLINNIIDQITGLVEPLLRPLELIISGSFKILDFLMGAVNAIEAIGSFLQCNEEGQPCPAVDGYLIGGDWFKGAAADVASVFDQANVARKGRKALEGLADKVGEWKILGTKVSDAQGSVGGCNTDDPFECGAPTVSIFGGGGSGAAGKVLLGNFVENTAGLSDVVGQVGSVVGVDLLSGGSGYQTVPFVSITDSCGLGYGGYARATINGKGEVESIFVVSSGKNYPVPPEQQEPLGITGATIENPGSGYKDGDTIDGFDLTIDNGRITKAVINRVTRVDQPLSLLKVNSRTGRNAVIRPIINTLPVVEKKLQEVIDCVN